jgi:alkylhydroperoxidase family enzyme
MARIEIPAGDRPEIERVWSIAPDLGTTVGTLSMQVYSDDRLLPWRVREAARMTIAHVNGCNVCMGWRMPELAAAGVDEELYAHVDDPGHATYSAPESLAIEYARVFATDHRSIDDAFFARLKEQFTDPEILELTICIGDWMAFGRLTAVLDLDEACAWAPAHQGQPAAAS